MVLESSYRVGLAYERLTLAVLKQYSFHLTRTGGKGDGGQDFTGYWKLPDRNIPVVGELWIAYAPINNPPLPSSLLGSMWDISCYQLDSAVLFAVSAT